jgi:hypothetical protein
MQQPALETSLRSRRPAAGTLLVLASVSLTGCIKPAQNADCVSVGMGWHACSGDATSSATGADAGSPGAIDASAAPEHLGRAQTGAAPAAADGGSAAAGAERESGGASASS